jgi:hypothetical protein
VYVAEIDATVVLLGRESFASGPGIDIASLRDVVNVRFRITDAPE